MFFSPNDPVLRKLTELHIVVPLEGMPEDNESNFNI